MKTLSTNSLLAIISSGRLTIRKRAIPALSALIAHNPALFDAVKSQIPKGLAAGGDTSRIWSAVLTSMARGLNASKVGKLINEGNVVQLVVTQTEDVEEVETVEGALTVSEDS